MCLQTLCLQNVLNEYWFLHLHLNAIICIAQNLLNVLHNTNIKKLFIN